MHLLEILNQCKRTFVLQNFIDMDAKKEIRDLTLDDIKNELQTIGEKAFRAQQIWDWLWVKQVRSIDEMSNLSKELRQHLKNEFAFRTITTDKIQVSEDGTQKFRFKTFDGHLIN